jgi:oligoribonuclease NrnB/cAMP/cGMP phosphodiesterase (DHH superfamily)
MKIFYHNDMDGIVSARIILQAMRHRKEEINGEDYIEMDYAKEFPLDIIKPNEQVYIVDYSIAPEQMVKLLEITRRVVWIDHHISAIEKYDAFKDLDTSKICGLRANGIAGCVLTYWYFHGRQNETEEFIADYPKNVKSLYRTEFPEYIKLAGDWDVWEHLYGQKTKEFTVCFNTRIKSPFDDNHFENLTDERNLEWFLHAGEDMIEYRNGWAETFMKRYGFETTIDGHRAYVANLGNGNSEFFGDLINHYDIVGTFCFNGDTYTCSLYSVKPEVNCADICVKRGGGGHKGAAGFVCKELPFKKEGN